MKKLFYAIVSSILLGCGTTPIIGSNRPFIVNEIVDIGNGLSEYYGGTESGYPIRNISGRPSIVMPSRLYNIGDTIRIK